MRRRRPLRKLSKKRAIAFAFALIVCFVFSLFQDESAIPPERCHLPEATQSEEKSRDVIRVCTWNVHNYNVSNRRVNGRWISYPKPEEERKIVCDVLSEINADIVLLQEMGDMTYLNELIARLEKLGQKYPYAAVSGDNSPARLAILSKISPERFFDFSNLKFTLKKEKCYSPRGSLGAKFNIRNREFFLFNLHLKSKVNAKKKDENFIPFRFAELRAIRKCVEKISEENSLILYAGDFNDNPTKSLLRNLGNVSLIKQSDIFGSSHTYHWHKKNILYQYDFFLASKKFLPFLSKATVCEHKNGSDHRPVYIDINLHSYQQF